MLASSILAQVPPLCRITSVAKPPRWVAFAGPTRSRRIRAPALHCRTQAGEAYGSQTLLGGPQQRVGTRSSRSITASTTQSLAHSSDTSIPAYCSMVVPSMMLEQASACLRSNDTITLRDGHSPSQPGADALPQLAQACTSACAPGQTESQKLPRSRRSRYLRWAE
jgi:hypothetical protein